MASPRCAGEDRTARPRARPRPRCAADAFGCARGRAREARRSSLAAAARGSGAGGSGEDGGGEGEGGKGKGGEGGDDEDGGRGGSACVTERDLGDTGEPPLRGLATFCQQEHSAHGPETETV